MTVLIRQVAASDVDDVVALSLRAWAPVFESFEAVLGGEIYRRVYPDWLASQAAAVTDVCREHAATTWVAVDDERPVGFVTVVFGADGASIEMLAVDPERQRRGIGQQLIAHALDAMRQAGVRLADVVTGGDPGHAPARRAYERAGFTALPLVRYYQAL